MPCTLEEHARIMKSTRDSKKEEQQQQRRRRRRRRSSSTDTGVAAEAMRQQH